MTEHWKSIATAPKDGTKIVVWRPTSPHFNKIGVDYWRENAWWYSRPADQPTHWCYLHEIMPCEAA